MLCFCLLRLNFESYIVLHFNGRIRLKGSYMDVLAEGSPFVNPEQNVSANLVKALFSHRNRQCQLPPGRLRSGPTVKLKTLFASVLLGRVPETSLSLFHLRTETCIACYEKQRNASCMVAADMDRFGRKLPFVFCVPNLLCHSHCHHRCRCRCRLRIHHLDTRGLRPVAHLDLVQDRQVDLGFQPTRCVGRCISENFQFSDTATFRFFVSVSQK